MFPAGYFAPRYYPARYFPKLGATPAVVDLLVNQNSLWWLDMLPPFYNQYVAITKSDTVNFPDGLCRAIYVGGAGIVVAVAEDDATCAFTAVAGEILPIKAKRVNATTTSASLMIALYQR